MPRKEQEKKKGQRELAGSMNVNTLLNADLGILLEGALSRAQSLSS